VIIVMGVAGAGKSTYGAALAATMGATFIEGDAHHSEAARAKMAAGQALDDADRWPWLDRIADAIALARAAGPVVATCSALRRAYRDALRARLSADLRFVFLHAARDELARRLTARRGHFMGVGMLAGQLATLELPHGEDDVAWVAAPTGEDDEASRRAG
jgi:gluconokinase